MPNNWNCYYYQGEKKCVHDYGEAILWNSKIYQLEDIKSVCLPTLGKLNWQESLIDTVMIGQRVPIQRGVIIADFKSGKEKFRVINVHLDWHGGEKHRLNQLITVIDFTKSLPCVDNEVICGDMNTIGPANSFEKNRLNLEKIMGIDYKNNFPELKHTTNSILRQELDHIYTKGFKLMDHEIMTNMPGSDHFPLTCLLSK